MIGIELEVIRYGLMWCNAIRCLLYWYFECVAMRLTKERSFDLSAGLKCRMGGLVVEHDGPNIYTSNKRDCTVVRINRESKSIDTFANTTDKAYASVLPPACSLPLLFV